MDLNVGDEAISQMLESGLRERLGGSVEVVRTLNTRRSRVNPGDGRCATSWRELFLHIRRSRLVVLGGGTLIQNDRGLAYYCMKVTLLSVLTRTPLRIAAVGVESLRWQYKLAYAAVTFRAERVSVRDAKSASSLGRWCRKTAVLSADPLFLATERAMRPTRSEFELAVSLRNDAPEEFLGALATALKSRGIKKALAVPTDRRPDADENAIRDLFARAEIPWDQVERSASWQSMSYELSDSACCIAMRLHACIFAQLVGTPTVVVVTENKTKSIADELQIPSVSLSADSATILRALDSAAAPSPDQLANLRCRALIAIDELVE